MKYVYFNLIVILTFTSCNPVVLRHETGARCEENMFGDKLNGEIKCWFSNNYIQSVIKYRKGKMHGPYTRYYFEREGAVRETGDYYWGNSVGVWKFYFENGNLKKTVTYEYNKEKQYSRKKGAYKAYFETGEIKESGSYNDKEKVGVWTYYEIDPRGLHKKKESGSYLAGDKSGVWYRYDEDGRRQDKLNYKSGRLVSTVKNGKHVVWIFHWVDYKQVWRKDSIEYYKDGRLVKVDKL